MLTTYLLLKKTKTVYNGNNIQLLVEILDLTGTGLVLKQQNWGNTVCIFNK